MAKRARNCKESRKQGGYFTGPHLKPAIQIHSILSHIHITVIIYTSVLIVQDFQSNSCVDFISLMRATFLTQPFLYTVKLPVMQLAHKSTSLIHQTQTSDFSLLRLPWQNLLHSAVTLCRISRFVSLLFIHSFVHRRQWISWNEGRKAYIVKLWH